MNSRGNPGDGETRTLHTERTMKILAAYLVIMNAAGLILMAADKSRAKKHKFRISEGALISVAALGGSLGVLFGIYAFRHKTRHPKFTVGVPVIILVQAAAALIIYIYL